MKLKQITLVLLLLVTISSLEAKIVYTKLSTPLSLTTTSSSGSGMSIDLDGKTYGDLQFRYDKWSTGEWFFHVQPYINISRIGCVTKTNKYTIPYVTMYSIGDTFSSASQFQSSSYLHPLLGDIEDSNFLNEGRKYIGIEFKLKVGYNGVNYCWMEVELTNSGTDKTLTVYSWAYEDVAGKSIIVGDTGSVHQNVLITSIMINSSSTKIETKGGTLQLSADISPSNATNKTVNWSVDNTNIATISNTGLLTAVNDGQIKITAEATDGSNVKGNTIIEIKNQNIILITKIQVKGKNSINEVFIGGNPLQMIATFEPTNASNKDISWSVDNENIATINKSGLLTAKAVGVVKVTAMSTDGSSISGSCSISIKNNNTSLLENIKQSVTIYPNPASDIMSISTSNNSYTIDQVSIYNLSGQEVLTSIFFNKSKVDLNVSVLSSGTYLLQVNLNEGQLIRKKIVIY